MAVGCGLGLYAIAVRPAPKRRLHLSALATPRICARHPGRPAIALCVACRTPICAGCATAWEGIQYCAGCLAVRRRSAGAARSFWGPASLVVGLLALAAALTGLRVGLAQVFGAFH